LIRRAGLVVAGAIAAFLAGRVAIVQAFGERRPELAAKIWPSHPSVVTALGMAAIGRSAAAGKPPSPEVTAALKGLVRRDPLNSAALLVAGTEASAGGDSEQAERLLRAASQRDPFAPAPLFLLTDLYLRQGRADEGLRQLSYLIGRVGPNATALLPALAEFARTRAGASQLQPLLSAQPQLRERLLETLAADPDNLSAILALASPRERPAPQWQGILLAAMVARQDYRAAHQVWLRLGGLAAGSASDLFNPRFLPAGPPPPFNWRLNSGSAGVAEAQPGGGLHVLYYGREDTVLTDQLLLLPPGRYRLEQEQAGSLANLSWALVCLPSGITQQAVAAREPRFTVAPACKAQRLELRGSIGDQPATSDATVRQVRLVLEGGA